MFVSEGEAVGLDPRLLVAIAGAETSFGTYGPSQTIHNPFGMGPGIVYPSWSDAIRGAAQNLGGPLYAGDGPGDDRRPSSGRWAPHGASNDPSDLNSNWTRNVGTYYAELGGDPQGAVFTGRVVAARRRGAGGDRAAPSSPGRSWSARRHPGPRQLRQGRGGGPGGPLGSSARPRCPVAATPETGFDASGLVRWVFGRHQVTLPRAADAQSRVGTAVKAAETCRRATRSSSRTPTARSCTRASTWAAGSSSTPPPRAAW